MGPRRMMRHSTLSGLVHDSSGKPVRDARIEIQSHESGQVVFSGYSNPGGIFEVANIPSGNYDLVATSGLVEARQALTVEGVDQEVSVLIPNHDPSASAGDKYSVSVTQLRVPERARKALHKAEKAVEKQNVADAEKYIDESLRAYPQYADALTLRGILKLDANQCHEAAQYLEQAIRFDPNYPLAYIALGSAYNLMSHWDDALRVLARGMTLSPAAWQVYFETGKALMGKRDYAAALQQLSKTQDLHPQYALVHLAKAHALVGLKDYAHAMTELETYLEREPQSSQSAEARATLEKIRSLGGNIAGPKMQSSQR